MGREDREFRETERAKKWHVQALNQGRRGRRELCVYIQAESVYKPLLYYDICLILTSFIIVALYSLSSRVAYHWWLGSRFRSVVMAHFCEDP